MFSVQLKKYRQQSHLSQAKLAKLLGVAQSTVGMWESGEREPDLNTINTISNVLNTPIALLLADNDAMFKIPLVGTIACGEPILAEQNIQSYVMPIENVNADFALRCKGNSMKDARICDGDIVFIRIQPDIENGQIAAVLIDNEATLKRVYKKSSQLILQPANSQYEPIVFQNHELKNIKILGKAVAFSSLI